MYIDESKIKYTLKTSRRAKRMKISIFPDGKIVVNIPENISRREADRFVEKNLSQIINKIKNLPVIDNKKIIKTSRESYLKHKEDARKLITERINYFNNFYKFKFNRIAIKNQKTLWGSCSQDGNLNFNYILALLPRKILDYVVVHEMCHLWHFDHSKDFWSLVKLTIPDYKEIRKEIKSIHFS